MTAYRYLSYDLRTNTLQQELPLRGVKFGGVLDNAGSFSAQCPLNAQVQTAPGVYSNQAAALLTATMPSRSIIFVEIDNVVLFDAYIIWTREYDQATQSLMLGGLSAWSYFQRRINGDATLTFAAQDQLLIAQTLINTAQIPTGGNINVTVGTETSGVLRDRTYNSYELKPFGEAVQELAAVDNGFDFAIDAAYTATTPPVPSLTFRCSYPQRGRSATNSGHVFESGRNIVSYKFPEDGTSQATRVYGIGAGDATTMLRSTQSRTDLIDAGYPLLDTSIAHKDVSVQATLDSWALSTVNAAALPVTIPVVTVTAGGDPPLGAWIVGDYAKFVFGTDPAKFDPRFPTRTELIFRIVAYVATPGDEGQGTVDLLLN